MDVCTPNGYVQRSTVSKSNMHHIPSLYTAMRKTTWGGLYPVLAEEDNRNAVSKFAKGTRIRSEEDDASVYPEDHPSSVDPKYRGDGNLSARHDRDSGERAVRGADKKRGQGMGNKEQDRRSQERDEPSMHNMNMRRSSQAESSRRDSFREEPRESRAFQQDGSSRTSSPSRSGASKNSSRDNVRPEEITASAGSAQYRKLQMIQAFGRETAPKQKETKSFGGANSVSSGAGGGAGGSAGGADAVPKSGLAGQLERMKRRREEKAKAAQQGDSSG